MRDDRGGRWATIMAMLECHEPSLVAWRVMSRVADAFMTVDEEDAIAVMNRLARPAGSDPAIVAGESGGAGLAGLMRAAADHEIGAVLHLGEAFRVFVITWKARPIWSAKPNWSASSFQTAHQSKYEYRRIAARRRPFASVHAPHSRRKCSIRDGHQHCC